MSNPRQQPTAFLAKNRLFPDGPFRLGTPAEVYLAAALATRLKNNIGNESMRYVAKIAQLSPQTVLNVLNGKTWPDLRTITKLEIALNA